MAKKKSGSKFNLKFKVRLNIYRSSSSNLPELELVCKEDWAKYSARCANPVEAHLKGVMCQ